MIPDEFDYFIPEAELLSDGERFVVADFNRRLILPSEVPISTRTEVRHYMLDGESDGGKNSKRYH